MAGIREKTENNDVPKAFKGTPAVLLISCLMAIAFYGFKVLVPSPGATLTDLQLFVPK